MFYDALSSVGRAHAEKSIASLKSAGIEERNDLDSDFWRDVARSFPMRGKVAGVWRWAMRSVSLCHAVWTPIS